MIPPDLHVHSNFSCDCQTSMEEMCRAAVRLGLSEIGFTEHYDLIPQDPCYAFFRADAWWEELEGCRARFEGTLGIRAGIELGEPHRFRDQMQSLMAAYPWDYALGSLHWVAGELIFDEGYFLRTPEAAYGGYFRELSDMVSQGGFDVLAHLDVVKRFGFDIYGSYDPRSHEDEIRGVLQACARQDLALEVNTAPLRRPVNETAPAQPILEWFRQEGGRRITFGSDAHFAEHIGHGAPEVVSAVREAGFEAMTTFELRVAKAVLLDT